MKVGINSTSENYNNLYLKPIYHDYTSLPLACKQLFSPAIWWEIFFTSTLGNKFLAIFLFLFFNRVVTFDLTSPTILLFVLPQHVVISGLNPVPPRAGSNRGSLPRAPSIREPPNSAELVQIHILLAVSD